MIIREKPALAPCTTLGLGGSALAEIRLESTACFDRLADTLASTGGSPRVLGGGSNLLIHDGELPLAILRLGPAFAHDPEIIKKEEQGAGSLAVVRISAGIPLPRLLLWCVRNGLSGLEGLAGIPGHLGGAIAMNAGAYGDSTAPLLRSLDVYTPERGIHTLHQDGWQAAYRHFSLTAPTPWFMAVAAELALRVSTPQQVQAKIKENLTRKQSSQPVHERTAGCIFQNPDGDSAGRLLDLAGMKGRRKGALYFSPLHANFMVHDTRCGIPGTCDDALELIGEAADAVRERFGITLQLEVKEWA